MDHEELHYILEGSVNSTTQNRDVILDTVKKLLIDVAGWAAKNITFIDMEGYKGLATQVGRLCSEAPDGSELTGSLLVILAFEESSMRPDREFTIAHEIAHHFLGHGLSHSNEAYEANEKAADELANAWGFTGNSVRVA